MAEKKSSSVRVDVSGTRYTLVRKVSEELNMTLVDSESDDCDLYWIDAGVPLEKYLQLKPFQMINHFSGMGEISRKDLLAKNIQKMKQLHTVEYDILPRTWILPLDFAAVSNFIKESKKQRKARTYIIKPHNSSMGNGISLARSVADIPQGENVIVQEYIENPLLLDGFKFDLRVYVLVTSCSPLRIFIYKDGLVRLSTESYQPPSDTNLHKNFMHLTNYSINKHSKSFDHHEDFDKGSKRSLKYLNGWLARNSKNPADLWLRVNDVVVKTLIVAQPHLKHSYQACRAGKRSMDKCQSFEILGFDILLDEDLKPWLLEVNRSPSFGIDAQIDHEIKAGVISDALRLVDVRSCDKSKKPCSVQQSTSHRNMYFLHKAGGTYHQRPRSPLNFAGEMEDSCVMNGRKIEEIKNRLSHLRKVREIEQFEEENKGEYVRIFPSPEPFKQAMYERFMVDSARLCFSIKPGSRGSVIKGLDKMKEKELIELLDQYESDEMAHNPDYKGRSRMVRPFTLREQSPLEAEFQAMAAREYEEEQTQRTMLSLNALEPSYPGKNNKEVKETISEVMSDWTENRSKVGKFWLNVLDSTKRRQLLCQTKDTIRGILHTHWRMSVLESVRLHKIFLRLFNFFLSNHGQGLWCTFPGGGARDENWEILFKRKTDVMSITEMCCCRRVVELVQGTVSAAFSYYEKQQASKKSNPPPPLLKRATITNTLSMRRPMSVYQQKKPSIVQLQRNSYVKQSPSKSLPLSHVTLTHSFPRISSTLAS